MTRSRRDEGAVAVLVAILAVVLFSVAALAVDLGNAFVRKRDAQSQADFAALAGAAALNGSNTKSAGDPAIIAVADYLNRNQPQSDGDLCVSSSDCVTAGQLVDGALNNGEVEFLSGYRMRVVTPPAKVNYAFANVMGHEKTAVRASATVGLRSPGAASPFFLPQDCASGQVQIKASNYNPGAPTYTPASGTGNAIADVNSLDQLTVAGQIPTTLRVFGAKFTSGSVIDFHKGGTTLRVPADTTTSLPATYVSGTELTIELPPGVYNRPGKWYLRVQNGAGYSRDAVVFEVGDPTPPPAGCGVKSTGDFGVIESPRLGVTQQSRASALNMAIGLDHELAFFAGTRPTPATDSCNGNGSTPYPGAIPDKVSQDGNNCVGINTGMSTDITTDGMISGVSSESPAVPGRLHTHTTDGCDRNGLSEEATRLGLPTNDDVLSCFLPTGVTVGDVSGASISTGHKGTIDARIFDSPRFMYVPLIDYPVNPQNGFYPIIGRAAVFITDEPSASTKGNSYASPENGVIIQSSKVVGLTAVVLNPDALPFSAVTSGPTVAYTGSGTKVIRLVE